MTPSGEQFQGRPEMRDAMSSYAKACLDLIEDGREQSDFPDPAKYLAQRGVEASENVQVHHRVQPLGVTPEQITCPDGSWGCIYECREIGEQQHCTYVCHC
ncbi:MAG: hypothetical protein QOE56_1724 [Solirubrobacterales bacterium]|jgi:hypothetical protein|nr:hypothetical protein [Solirubrobacterales bacterium]